MLHAVSSRQMTQGLDNMGRNHITTALEAFRHAAAWEESIHSLNLSGLCCYRLGRFNHAKAYWERSLLKDGEGNAAKDYLSALNSPQMSALREDYRSALNLMVLEDYKGAAQLLKKGGGIDHFVSFANLLGLCCYGMKKSKKAYRYFLKALTLDRGNPVTHRYLRSAEGAVPGIKACRQLIFTLLEE